jgi:PAS domain S-box-containing protein
VNLSVFQKGLVVVAIPLLFQLSFVLVVVQLRRESVAAEWWTAHTREVIAGAGEVRVLVADGTVSARGYVITADPAFAAGFHHTRAVLPGRLDALERLVSDNPGQAERARAVRAAAVAVVDWQTELVGAVAAGATGDAVARVRTREGEERRAAFHTAVGAFVAEEERLSRERAAALERSRERLSALLALGGVAAVVATLLAAAVFRRGIAGRFAALEDRARRLAAGERLPAPPPGGDEIAGLERTFHGMAAELTQSAAAVRDLYDQAPCGYHSIDAAGTVLAMNRTALGWLGAAEGDVIGRKRFADFVAPGSRAAYAATVERVVAHGSAADVELELVRADGTTFPVLLNSSAETDAAGRFVRSRTTLTDLTERKRAEAATRALADVTRNVPVGLITFRLAPGEPDGGLTLVAGSGNECAARMLGFSFDESIGRRIDEVFPAIPGDILRRYTAVAAGGTPDDLGELCYGDARVAERWWSAHAFPLPERAVGIAFQDISARKRAETEVRRLNEQLERRVQERTAELERANRDLAQKNAENEMFVYSVSHDLRSPLVNLQGFSKELEKACKWLGELFADESLPAAVRQRGSALLAGEVAKSLGFIQSAVMRLSGIIDALLQLSRVGRVDYRWEAVDVGQVVARVVTAAQGTIAARGASVTVGALPPAHGDRVAVEQLFGNLIGNALTYLDPARPGVIEVGALEAAGGAVTYYVRDNGLGIAEAHKQKIFQAFQRAHPGVGSGEGLGLAIVARVAERHRGRVWVESRPGAGSTFYVSLPAAPR